MVNWCDKLKEMRTFPIVAAFVALSSFLLVPTAVVGSHGDGSAGQLRIKRRQLGPRRNRRGRLDP